MTNDQHDDQPSSDDDPWDPIVAERFGLLGRADVPPLGDTPDSLQSMSAPIPIRDRARTPWVLAAAAALVVLAGAAVVSLAGRGDGTGVEATDESAGLQSSERLDRDVGAEDGTDDRTLGGTDEDRSTSSLVVAVDPTSTDRTFDDDATDRPGVVTTDVPEPSATTATTAIPTPTDPTASTSASIAPTTTTTSTSTSISVSLTPEKEAVSTIRGTASEVFNDCRSHLALDAQGEVVNLSPVSCDGGSWVVVNGNRIQTSSGFVSSDQAYDKHLPDLQPGQSVTVVALRTARGLTLECVQCGIRLAG